MLLKGVGKVCEPPAVMACRAIRGYPVFGELSVVVIGMAIGTTIMLERIGQIYLVA